MGSSIPSGLVVGIIDYGLGNIRSIVAAVERVGFQAKVTYDANELRVADKLILPGVGAFGDGMKNIRERKLDKTLNELVIDQKKPILGICLGFHLLAKTGHEFGKHEGLGWIDAEVVPLQRSSPEVRIPHVGWNELTQTNRSSLFEDIPSDALFYYTHSFHIPYSDKSSEVIGVCDYGQKIVAAIQKENIFGTQFHPEKSQKLGLSVLHNFLRS